MGYTSVLSILTAPNHHLLMIVAFSIQGLGLGLGLGRQSSTHDWDLVLGSVVYTAFALNLTVSRRFTLATLDPHDTSPPRL